MEPQPSSSSYPAQTQPSDIDPRLQEAIQTSKPYANTSQGADTTQFRVSNPPPHQQQHQHPNQQSQYGPPQWHQEGYYYGPTEQQPPQISHVPHQQSYQNYHEGSDAPSQLGDNDSKRPRACEACRGLKVRCEPDPRNGPCKRCAKANRHCVITPPSRKRQKKTDSRVAELERKIDALTATLHATKEGNNSGSDEGNYDATETSRVSATGSTPQQQPSPYSVFDGTNRKRRMSRFEQDGYAGMLPAIAAAASGQQAPIVSMGPNPPIRPAQVAKMQDFESSRSAPPPPVESADVIGRGVLSLDIATQLFDHYSQNMVPQMPLVPMAPDSSVEIMRTTKPILFLAIMNVASSQNYPQTQRILKFEVKHTLADKIIIRGEKSVELVQALAVTIIWYWPEEKGESQYFQLAHLGAVMAMDLGIDRSPNRESVRSKLLDIPGPKSTFLDTESLECRRTWLGCYLLCSSISMGKRRLNIVRPGVYIDECITRVQEADKTDTTDIALIHWVKLQVLADDLTSQALPEDSASVTESKIRNAYEKFKKQLNEWEVMQNEGLYTSKLTFASNVVKLYMHELMMQHETGPDPSKTTRGRGKAQSQASPSGQTSAQNPGLTAILGILDTFLGFNEHDIRTLPSFQFAQVSHASVSMMKMFFVAKSDSEFSKTTPVTQTMVEGYIQRISDLLLLAAKEGKSTAARTFLMIYEMLRVMFNEHKDSDLQTIRARYGGVPSTRQAQLLDLEEPAPIPQRKTTRGLEENTRGALHVLSEVAMEDSHAKSLRPEESHYGSVADQLPSVNSSELAAVGQLIGDQLGTVDTDDAFFGIMQTMWARSATLHVQ